MPYLSGTVSYLSVGVHGKSGTSLGLSYTDKGSVTRSSPVPVVEEKTKKGPGRQLGWDLKLYPNWGFQVLSSVLSSVYLWSALRKRLHGSTFGLRALKLPQRQGTTGSQSSPLSYAGSNIGINTPYNPKPVVTFTFLPSNKRLSTTFLLQSQRSNI